MEAIEALMDKIHLLCHILHDAVPLRETTSVRYQVVRQLMALVSRVQALQTATIERLSDRVAELERELQEQPILMEEDNGQDS